MNLGELASWLDEHSHIPSKELPDEPFVIKYVIYDPENKDNPGDIGFSYLLDAYSQLVLIFKSLFKLMQFTSDANKNIFPFGVSLTTHERHEL